MSDIQSELPVRSQLPGQVLPDDIIVKIGDGTNPTTQFLGIDSAGKIFVKLDDGAGNAITSQANGAQQALDVGINVGGVQIDPRSIRALTSADVVTVDQGTSPWVTKDQSDGPVTPGTVASFSQLIGGQYNSALPTLTTGQQSAIQVDSSGRLLVVSTSTDDHNYGTVGANTLRTAAQIGNATGAADFNFGSVGAQTLRAAAQIGNATGAADFNAGATGAQTLRTTSNQGAPGTAANGWFVRPTDGTNSQAYTAAGEAKVTVTEPLPAGTNSIGTVVASNFPTTVDTNYGTVGANTIRTASEIGNATGAADFNNGATSAQTLRVAANLAVGGANVSGTNPVPVSITSALIGTSVNDYNTASAVAAGATSNHDYTITTSKTFQGKKIWASASDLIKIEVQVSPDGVAFSTLWVGFSSSANPNITIDLDELVFLESGTGSKIRIIRTNEGKKSMDLYSTISGTEV